MLVRIGRSVGAGLFLLVADPAAHAQRDAFEHGVHILEDVFRGDAHHAHAHAFEALVAAFGQCVVLPFLVDGDGHAEIVAVEIDDCAADHRVAGELVTPQIGLGETRRERLVRRARMPPHLARLIVQRIEPGFGNLPPTPLLLERGSGIGSFVRRAELEGFAGGH